MRISTDFVVSLFVVCTIVLVTIVPLFLPQVKDASTNHSNNSQKEHKDVRCKCICPPFNSDKTDNSTNKDKHDPASERRKLFIDDTTPDQCDCNHFVISKIPNISSNQINDYCVRCECKYQSRNTSTIKRVVYFFIAVLGGFMAYITLQVAANHFKFNPNNLSLIR